MSNFPKVRRILRLHAAHRTVGVSGVASPLCARSRGEPFSTLEPETQPLTVLLVSASDDHRSRAASAAFERTLLGRGDVQCERVDLAMARIRGLARCECAIVFGQGLQVVGHWSAFEAESLDNEIREGGRALARIEVADSVRWHPLLDGVDSFTVPGGVPASVNIPVDATPLLVARSAHGIVPVAWARHGDDRSVYTLLGQVENSEQPEFVRLLLNAIEWVRR
jgi:hypothetical protein